MINRECGSGIRVWLDCQLSRLGLPPDRLLGYGDAVASHLEVARAVYEGRADVGLGLRPCACAFDLDFLPLFEEPYDLALTQATLVDARFSAFFDRLHSGEFRRAVEEIGGYHITAESGGVEVVG